ncbi:FecR family protein [Sphingobacterium sp. LRF_L2]|uniref:FecR family protein n=1 Tax=Sphingobacterium sp. LRF_L2 TaxID=3369421 RepID=UPI003F63B831
MGEFSTFLRRFFRRSVSGNADKLGEIFRAKKLEDNSDQQASEQDVPHFNKREVWQRIDSSIENYEQDVASSLRMRTIVQIAAFFICCLCLSAMAYYLFENPKIEAAAETNTITTKKGEIRKVSLPDGSLVWLNNESSLTFPLEFGKKNRNVTLSGEGYFDVYRDENRPFVITTENFKTRVLGTQFIVREYSSDEESTVAVISGSVQVSKNIDRQVEFTEILGKSDRIIYHKGIKKITRDQSVDLQNITSWKEGKLSFQNVSLLDVANTLQRRFNVRIKVDPTLYEKKIYADFEQKSVETIMKVLSMLAPAQLTLHEGYYEFTAE